jgi:ABC transporter
MAQRGESLRERTERSDMLELQGLTRRYGDVVALDGLSFTVAEGQMFGFVGPNGAGKTTAMRIVLGVLEPDAGEVRWRGRPVDAETRRRFGYMPEDHGQTFLRQCARVPGARSSCRPASPPRAWPCGSGTSAGASSRPAHQPQLRTPGQLPGQRCIP